MENCLHRMAPFATICYRMAPFAIATADDAMHDVAESIENLLKNLGFIEE